MWLYFFALLQSSVYAVEIPDDAILDTRSSISETERHQRQVMAHLFVINQRIKAIAKKKSALNDRLFSREAAIRDMAQDVVELETKSNEQSALLASRLRQIFHGRSRQEFEWLFTASSPIEMEKHQRFLRKMVDSEHRVLRDHLTHLERLRSKKRALAGLVRNLMVVQKSAQTQELELTAQMRQKSRLVADLRRSRDTKIFELKSLREQNSDIDYLQFAFFERKGTLRAPIDAHPLREFGSFVDSEYRFRLMYKGNFYGTEKNLPVTAIFDGKVVLAARLPGYGRCVILDHGDNYYTVYGFASSLRVSEGASVKEGDIIAQSGGDSPLFGPGLYFEIRHFTDAVDPRPWIKESGIKTAKAAEGGVQ